MSHSSKFFRLAAAALAATLIAAPALAGGPLAVFDPEARIPYAWPAGVTPVYTDLGALGQLTNEQADAMVGFSWGQWNAVPTSTFQAGVVGDFAALGLGDIDASNIDQVLGVWNGGGIHVVYDADGGIVEGLFGLYGVLGFAILEWVSADTPEIAEVTVVFNGNAVPGWMAADQAAAAYAGVVTHEFGHAVNLAHTQTNGQLIFYYDSDQTTWMPNTGAAGCTPPYPGTPPSSAIDTMYPYSAVSWNGPDQSTVDVTDDISALSDIYPAAGWPQAHAGITGTIFRPDGETEHMGANVIARNNADPWMDAISGLSGDTSQGLAGDDGTYVFNGLTAGASYTVYVDGIIAGAFSTPYATLLPGPEEFYNGAAESGDMLSDDRCEATPVTPAAGSPAVADIVFNAIKGGPRFIPVDMPSSGASSVTADGSVVVGASAYGVWRWTEQDGFEQLGGAYSSWPDISRNGRYIGGDYYNEDGYEVAALWLGGDQWLPLGGLPGSTGCDALWSSSWGISDKGTIAGLAWDGCLWTSAYTWSARGGWDVLGFTGGGSRADDISADGRTVVGWDKADNGFWRGAVWQNGVEILMEQEACEWCDPATQPWCPGPELYSGALHAVNGKGTIAVGEGYQREKVYVDEWSGTEYRYCSPEAYRWTDSGGVESLGEFTGYRPTPADVTEDGRIVVGNAWPDDPWGNPVSWIWTDFTSYVNFTQFIGTQGLLPHDWILVSAATISGDGRVMGGTAASPFSFQGWIVQMDRAVVCHAAPGNPADQRTILVDFPDSLEDHLAHGDVIGICGSGAF